MKSDQIAEMEHANDALSFYAKRKFLLAIYKQNKCYATTFDTIEVNLERDHWTKLQNSIIQSKS